MRALRSYGADDIRVADVPEPVPTDADADDKVIIDVDWCGICGSDLALYHAGPEALLSLSPSYTASNPLILGHELTGRLTHIPPTSSLPLGARVVVDPRLVCGTCGPCTTPAAAPQTQGCARGISFIGFTTKAGGGFAERVAVGAKAVWVVGKNVGGEVAALVEPVAVAWHAVKRAGVEAPGWVSGGSGEEGRMDGGKKAEDTAVLVVGGGPVGVAVCWVLRAWGVGRVVVSEPLRERREGCGRVPGVVVVDPGVESVVERCKEVTGGRGVDVVFDCAGSPRVVGDVFGGLAFRGTVVVVALWKGEIPVPFPPLMYKETTVTASCAYNETDFGEVVKAFSEGRLKGAESMITARISLEDVVEKGFEALSRPDNSHVKILVTPKKEYLT